ncbi:hypothetical protein F2Q69_00019336 [Brassica cretica]|uniref:Arabidopsis retrotransposon Orf1 C-terminal domain-containing protein n=1 Tax=Brassica cretica TaxID=69181 RepID=A0A8S9PZK2_BRACR|nr:hypothetical protein F2Q69_00019336 [Brassica cretica]
MQWGIAPLYYQTHELYPDLVRQALATSHIGYDNPQAPTYENCSFSFLADGKFCFLSLDQLNEIYEISDERKDVAVENKFTPTERFWDLIATRSGSFASRKAYQSQIRYPTLRVITKMVSNLLFAKDQTSKVTKGELQMLYSGLEDEIRRSRPISACADQPWLPSHLDVLHMERLPAQDRQQKGSMWQFAHSVVQTLQDQPPILRGQLQH